MEWLETSSPIASRVARTAFPAGPIEPAEVSLVPAGHATFAVSSTTGGWAVLDDAEVGMLQAVRAGAVPTRIAQAFWERGLVRSGTEHAMDAARHAAAVEQTREHYSLVLLLNSGCNLACTYCYLGHELPAPPNAMPPGVVHAAIDQAMAQPWPEILIDFGEIAVAAAAFVEAVEYATQAAADSGKRLQLSIQTNGTTIDDRMADFLAEHSVSVGLSIDGEAAHHDSARVFRSGAGSSARARAGLQRCVDRGVPVHVPVTIGRHNIADPASVLDEIASLGVGSWLFKPILAHGEAAAAWDSQGVSAAEYASFMTSCIRLANQRSIDLLDTTARNFLWRLAGDPRGWRGSCTSRTCGSGRSLHVVDARGGVHACPRYVDDTPLATIPAATAGSDGRRMLPMLASRNTALPDVLGARLRTHPDSCAGCPWLRSCGGGCTLSGEPDDIPAPDPHCVAYDRIHQVLASEVLPAVLAGRHDGARVLRGLEVRSRAMSGASA